MAKYLVLQRMSTSGAVSYKGDVLDLDPFVKDTAVLMERGYIVPVPDTYPSVNDKVAEAVESVAVETVLEEAEEAEAEAEVDDAQVEEDEAEEAAPKPRARQRK